MHLHTYCIRKTVAIYNDVHGDAFGDPNPFELHNIYTTCGIGMCAETRGKEPMKSLHGDKANESQVQHQIHKLNPICVPSMLGKTLTRNDSNSDNYAKN